MEKKIQKKKNQLKTKFLTLSIIFLVTVTSTAQDYVVTPLSDFTRIYKEKSLLIMDEIETNKKYSSEEKLMLYENKIATLKEDFKNSRKSEYLTKSVKRTKRLECKGNRIRGITDCQPVSINSPVKSMYTQKDWVKVEGEDKYMKVFIDDAYVMVNMSATGTRTKKGIVYVIFKYKPEAVSSIVDKEAIELFNQILSKKE